jgi:hypothetical protein
MTVSFFTTTVTGDDFDADGCGAGGTGTAVAGLAIDSTFADEVAPDDPFVPTVAGSAGVIVAVGDTALTAIGSAPGAALGDASVRGETMLVAPTWRSASWGLASCSGALLECAITGTELGSGWTASGFGRRATARVTAPAATATMLSTLQRPT